MWGSVAAVQPVQSAWSGVTHDQAIERLSVGEVAVGKTGTDIGVSEVVGDLRFVIEQPDQRHRAGGAIQAEAGVEIGAGRLSRLTVSPDEFEFTGGDGAAGRERPLGQVGVVIVGQVIARESDGGGAGVVKLDPWLAFREVVRRASEVVRLKFIEPERIVGR